jgi:predicted AlkP superfamily pyrophosphatase or phosphodiesterase
MIQFKNMKKILTIILFVVSSTSLSAQKTTKITKALISRPKLMVGIVIDQMRWDYLYRYFDRYGEGGFKRLLQEGFRCENAYINYLPSATAVGHSAIFSGTTPAINGIASNDWVDQLTGVHLYCTSDSTVNSVGTTSIEGKMSPRNLLSSTITDELRIATNFKSKVVGISLKDRGSILPAGHTPTGAFWFDDTSGRFITSTYYMDKLPDWVNNFNALNEPEKLTAKDWNSLYPLYTYIQSTNDNSGWEGKFKGETAATFPHHISELYKVHHVTIRSTPFGNTLTLDFAKAAIDAYRLGQNNETDFLTINCASTDYVGHMFGPNAVETEDTYLRLDKDLAEFFKNLDDKIGRGNYTIFLTADHGASNSVEYNKSHNIPAGYWKQEEYRDKLNQILKAKFNVDKLVISVVEYQVNFNIPKIKLSNLNYETLKKIAVNFLRDDPSTLFVADMAKLNEEIIPDVIKTKMINAYNYRRSGAIMIIPASGWLQASTTGTSHGEWNPYDTHIPLIFMGWGIKPGISYKNVYTTDIAPTVAALLHIQVPNGSIGSIITEVFKR